MTIASLHSLRVTASVTLVATAVAGCATISPQQEADMGLNYATQINAQLPICAAPTPTRYINQLGNQLARLAGGDSRSWRFSIVDDPEINAFAVPGGYIYINKGLIMRAQTAAQLAGVVGHEIAHVTQRHSVQQMEQGQKVGIGATLACILKPDFCQNGGGQLLNLGATAMMAKFSRSDESEADRFGVQYVLRAGFDPRGLPEMFSIMLAERDKRGGGGSASWLASHPIEEDRIANTNRAIAALPAGSLDGVTRDNAAFQRFKSRLGSLPQTPKPAVRLAAPWPAGRPGGQPRSSHRRHHPGALRSGQSVPTKAVISDWKRPAASRDSCRTSA
ncbi:MAG: M48 family metallopeptidase [Gemmatimonadaceae bacterium]|nr:M48 family metallopeptidase [Gemmatimonadaceae bacterium]